MAELLQNRFLDTIRQGVSKKKTRFQKDGFDLDLSYITPRIIAMGFPSTGLQAAYRNPLRQVQSFFSERHGDAFKVYNLCTERGYDLKGTFPLIERWPFEDHNICPLEQLIALIDDIAGYLASNERHVVAVHCKAGKGRTGMVISALLLRLGICQTASQALRLFAERRTSNSKGVTIPSQRRYVQYYERLLRNASSVPGDSSLSSMAVPVQEFWLHGLRLTSVPAVTSLRGSKYCTPYFKVLVLEPPEDGDAHQPWELRQLFCYRDAMHKSGGDLKSFECGDSNVHLDCARWKLKVSGEILIKFFAAHHVARSERMFQVWFNTAFLQPGQRMVQFSRMRIDGVHKDKKFKSFSPEFALQFFMQSTSRCSDASDMGRRDALPKHSFSAPDVLQELSAASVASAGSESDDDLDLDQADVLRKDRRSLTAGVPCQYVCPKSGDDFKRLGLDSGEEAKRRPTSLPAEVFRSMEEDGGCEGDSSSLEDLSTESDDERPASGGR